ncbi:hypothetical protein KAU19_02120 [Candidatus Parcubacteria bacterium]|nr:hypothetical protein [Candidatus Parcubacteria bacterium]
MYRYIKVILFSLICLVGTFFVLTSHAQAQIQTIPAPTMIEPGESAITGKVKPLIKGLTISGTFVRVYIDGIYNGKTEILTHDSGTANFAYKPFLNLEVGEHNAWTVAEDKSGRKSQLSNILYFRIEQPMPAPTIFSPVINIRTTHNRPFIVGLAKNNSLIKVFIDHKLDGQFQITNHESGAANFAYQPFQGLTKGNHLVYTTAIDDRGKESCWSNIIYFTVKQPAIAQVATEEASDIVVEVKELEPTEEEPVVTLSEEAAFEEDQTGKIVDDEIQQIIEEGIKEKEADTGLIDEDKEKQGKLNFNLIIFIVFLLGIIAWIFWVNRELIKERRAQAKKAQDEIKDKIDKTKPPTIQDIEKSDKDDLPPPPQEQPPLV